MNTFLQLRENNAEIKNSNGDFTTKLKKPISLEEGDQVILNKAIIDSRSIDSGKIVFEENTNMRLDFFYYLRNYDLTGKQDKDGNPWTNADLDSNQYILSSAFSHGADEVVRLNKMFISSQGSDGPNPLPFALVFNYYPIGSPTPFPLPIKFELKDITVPYVYESEDNLDILAVKKPGKELFALITPQSTLNNLGLDLGTLVINTSPEPSASSHYEPFRGFVEATIQKGSYTPDDLAKRLSKQLTQIRDDIYVAEPTGNSLLLNCESGVYTALADKLFIVESGEVNATSTGTSYKGAFQYLKNGTQNFYFGTTQLTIEYDAGTNRFQFSYLHTPYYTLGSGGPPLVGGGDMAVKFFAVNNSSTDFVPVNQVSGILLTSMTAFKQDGGEQLDIWDAKMGFNQGDICVFPKYKRSALLNAQVPHFPSGLTLGQNITGGELGVDLVLDKQNGLIVPPLSDIERTISETIPIRARGNLQQLNLASGYFVIEIQGLNTQLITNRDIKNHIFGIVSRYYENGNYTAGSEADAIIYQHVGAPLYLNELKVRILDSNYQVANLGDDNTIFLQVLKQPKQPAIENKKEESK